MRGITAQQKLRTAGRQGSEQRQLARGLAGPASAPGPAWRRPGGHAPAVVLRPRALVRDVLARQTYLDLEVLCQWLDAVYQEEGVPTAGASTFERPPLGKCRPVLRRMLKALDDAMDVAVHLIGD